MHLALCPFGDQKIATHNAFKTSCIPSLKRMGTMYGESGGPWPPLFVSFGMVLAIIILKNKKKLTFLRP
jgi:hypothetical protein